MIGALLFILIPYIPVLLLAWFLIKVFTAKSDTEQPKEKKDDDDSGWLFYL